MTRKTALSILLVLSLVLVIIGALFRISHWPYGRLILSCGTISAFVFVLICLVEVIKSDNIRANEKLMWSVGFLFFGLFTGIIYLILGRDRVINT